MFALLIQTCGRADVSWCPQVNSLHLSGANPHLNRIAQEGLLGNLASVLPGHDELSTRLGALLHAVRRSAWCDPCGGSGVLLELVRAVCVGMTEVLCRGARCTAGVEQCRRRLGDSSDAASAAAGQAAAQRRAAVVRAAHPGGAGEAVSGVHGRAHLAAATGRSPPSPLSCA